MTETPPTPECIGCGAPLVTMAARSAKRCHLCEARKREAVKEREVARVLALEHLADMAMTWADATDAARPDHEAKLRKAIARFRGLDGV